MKEISYKIEQGVMSFQKAMIKKNPGYNMYTTPLSKKNTEPELSKISKKHKISKELISKIVGIR